MGFASYQPSSLSCSRHSCSLLWWVCTALCTWEVKSLIVWVINQSTHTVFHPVCGVSRGPFLYNSPLVRESGSQMFLYNTTVAWSSYSWETLKSQTANKVGGIYRRMKALLTFVPKYGSCIIKNVKQKELWRMKGNQISLLQMSVGQIKTGFLPLNFWSICWPFYKELLEHSPLYLRISSQSTKLTAAVNRLDTQISHLHDTMEVRKIFVQVTGDRQTWFLSADL